MNYEVSENIFLEIKNSENILVNCHKDPDPDSIGSALALQSVLRALGKKVTVVCVSNNLFDQVSYLPGYSDIQKGVDFSSFDFSKYDLLISPDSSSVDRVTGNSDIEIPIKTVVIDHHKTNSGFGNINLIDGERTSVGEMLFDVFEDFDLKLDKEQSTCLMAAIVGDTGAFRYPKTSKRTFEIIIRLMELGADKDVAIFNIYRSDEFAQLKFWGEVLIAMQKDTVGKYVWSAVSNEVYEKCGKPINGKETAASLFTQNVNGTDFGFVAVEDEPGNLNVSFRSRTGFDTSKIALDLGGGGHIYASGAKIKGMSFDVAVKTLLEVVDKHTKKST